MPSLQRTAHGSRDVVVGVDGTPASTNAVRYALAEAARSNGRVDVIHVIPDAAVMAGPYAVSPGELMAEGRSVLQSALDRLGPVDSVVPLDTHVCGGAVVGLLASAGEDARAIVVGGDRRPLAMRLLTGNVSTGVAARSAVPVVSVPETWRPDEAKGVVLVGVKHPKHSEALLAEAFRVAHGRGSRLVVLHAWQSAAADADDDVFADRGTLDDWGARAQRELDQLVAPWIERHPDVEVELRSVHDQAAHAMVAESEQVDELVIVRRAHGVPGAAHLGSTARTLLLHSHCPVRVVPSAYSSDVPDLDLEAGGIPLKDASF